MRKIVAAVITSITIGVANAYPPLPEVFHCGEEAIRMDKRPFPVYCDMRGATEGGPNMIVTRCDAMSNKYVPFDHAELVYSKDEHGNTVSVLHCRYSAIGFKTRVIDYPDIDVNNKNGMWRRTRTGWACGIGAGMTKAKDCLLKPHMDPANDHL